VIANRMGIVQRAVRPRRRRSGRATPPRPLLARQHLPHHAGDPRTRA
jgi:hypothetical protein